MDDFDDAPNPPGAPLPPGPPDPEPPVVLTPPGHAIRRADIDPDALKILGRLQRMGFVAYLCGGAVRDLLVGRKPKDFDIATDARPGQIKKRFANVFVIGRRFRLAHVHCPGGKIVEVATFRREPERGEEVDPNVPPDPHAIYGTPREDAFRRDITINALYYDPEIEAVIDYVGGLADMRARRVRTIGEPGVRFAEDPVRVWRVLRHAARLGFEVETATARAIPDFAHLVATASGARLYEEFNKDLAYETRPVFEALRANGLLRHILGEIGLAYETQPALFARISALLDVEERARRGGFQLAPEEMYALVFWPWLEPLFHESIEDMVPVLASALQEAGMRMTIPKALRANAVQILALVDALRGAIRTGHVRSAWLHRSHVAQATRLLFLIAEGRPPVEGESFETLLRRAHPEAAFEARMKRRRRRRRGRRAGGGTTPAQS